LFHLTKAACQIFDVVCDDKTAPRANLTPAVTFRLLFVLGALSPSDSSSSPESLPLAGTAFDADTQLLPFHVR
jgi:hypothetical protein